MSPETPYVLAVFELWDSGEKEMNREDALVVEREFNILLEDKIPEIYRLIEKDAPQAVGRYKKLIAFFNSLLPKLPRLYNKISEKFDQLLQLGKQLAEHINADGFTIGVEGPVFSMYVEFHFSITGRRNP